MQKLCLFLLINLFCVVSLNAAIEVYEFDTPDQEERFKQLSDQLRCPMCLNANLSGSDAPIAADLRVEIYEQIIDGRSNDQIIDFMTQRYGDFINYRPPLNRGTILLWFGPLVLLLSGLLIVWRMVKRNEKQAGSLALSVEEKQKLERILEGKEAGRG